MAKKSKEVVDKPEKTRIETYKERYKVLEDLWKDNREAALEDKKFASGEQWPETLKNKRKNRPCLVVDKLNQYVRQVVNDARQNRPSIQVDAVDDSGDEEIAETLKGLIRHVLNRSNADEAIDCAGESAAESGFGFYRVITEYVDENSFNQEPRVARIANSLSVLMGEFEKADSSDKPDCFIVSDMPKAEFKRRYPKAEKTNFEDDAYSNGWSEANTVRVCEYYYKEESEGQIHLLENGETIEAEAYQRIVDEGVKAPAIVQTKSAPVTKVKWCRMSGAEILEESEWLGKHVPVIFVIGHERNIEGKVIYEGMIRSAKDPQRLYNYARSGFAEIVAYTGKNPYIAAVGQVDDRAEWEDSNVESYSVLKYNPVDVGGVQLPPPRREGQVGIPEGFARDMQMSEHDIQGALGMYASSLGQRGNATSGKQEMAQIRESDTGTFHFQDNAAKAIRFLGEILVDVIPKYIDSKRIIRILGEDGTSQHAEVDPNQEQPVVRMGSKVIYNLNIGSYDVTVKAGPSYTTKREETAAGMMLMVQANPEMWQSHGDLIAKAQDWQGADEFAKRSKLMLPPPIQQAIQEENQGNPEVQAVKAQAQQAIDQLQQQIQAAEQGIQERDEAMRKLEMELKAAKTANEADMMKISVDQFNAETQRMKVQSELVAIKESPIEALKLELDEIKLQYEDRWKQLEAQTKLEIARISKSTSLETALISADSAQRQSENSESGETLPNNA